MQGLRGTLHWSEEWETNTLSAARAQEWNYMRGGLSTIDRDYGLFSKVHHDIGTHVVHHLFPQIPHYHLTEATEVRLGTAPTSRAACPSHVVLTCQVLIVTRVSSACPTHFLGTCFT